MDAFVLIGKMRAKPNCIEQVEDTLRCRQKGKFVYTLS